MKNLFKTTTAFTLAVTVLAQPLTAEMVTKLGAGEGQLNIVAWPGYIERGETVKSFDWVSGFEESTGCMVNVKTANTTSYGEIRIQGYYPDHFLLQLYPENAMCSVLS